MVYLLDNLHAHPWLGYAVVGFIGACLGSFLTMLSYRLPLEQPVVVKRSHCTACNATLRVRDLIPIASWIMFRGRCRHCGTPVSMRYVLIEMITMLSVVAVYHTYSFSADTFIFIGLACCVIGLIVTDLEHYMIPDTFQVGIALLALVYGFHHEWDLAEMVMSAFLGITIGLTLVYGFRWIYKKDGLGFGDVKLLGVAGLWLGTEALAPFLFLSGVLGIISAMLWRMIGKGAVFPFGPALALAMIICIFCPEIAQSFWNLGDWLTPLILNYI